VVQGILVDYAKDGRSIGIEITAPKQISRQAVNQVIVELSLPPFTNEELAPLLATCFYWVYIRQVIFENNKVLRKV
jgi:hypothetical protein